MVALQRTSFHSARSGLPIVPPGRPPAAADFLAPYYAMMQAEHGSLQRAVAAVLRVAFVLWVPLRCAHVALADRRSARWYRAALRYCRATFCDPLEVSLFGLSGADRRTHMRRFELAGVLRRISPAGWRAGCALNDKLLFDRRCREAGLPVPRPIEPGAPPPSFDLILKPADGRSGHGLRLARRLADGRFRLDGRRRPVTSSELVDLAGASRPRALLAERVVNHPALAELALDALATLRLTTCVDERGGIEIVTAALRMPGRRGIAIDSLKHGGLAAAVDMTNGRLGVARGHRRPGVHRRHPVSGAAISGLVLPDWPAAMALARDAHGKAFAEYVVVGWDIALTARGPILIEGNSKPSVILAQLTPRRGLGDQRFGALIAFHLARVASEQAFRPAAGWRVSSARG